jgi:PAS domain S-box-containing protein
MLRLSLRTRGLILIGFPLLCQLVFVCILMFFLWQIQEEIQRRTESRDFVAEVSKLHEELMDLTISFTRSGPEDDARKIQEVDALVQHLKNVEQLASRKPNRGGDLDNLKQSVRELIVLFSRWRQQQYGPGHASSNAVDVTLYKETRQRFQTSAKALSNIIADEESTYAATSLSLHPVKSDIKTLFVEAAVASALSAIVFGYVYAVLITRPIAHLSANVRLLSERKGLNELLATADDFAALDQVLHDVARSIEEASIDARALLDNAQALICSLTKDGTFVSASHYCTEMLGFTPDELLGKQLVEITVPEDHSVAGREFEAARLAREQRSFELSLRRKDGSLVDTRWSCFWSSIDDSLFSVIADITEERRIANLKKDFVELLRQDLHRPLTAMGVSLSLVSEAVTEGASIDVRRRVQSMSKNVQRLIALVNALLESQKFNTSRMQLKLEYYDLQLIVAEAVEMVRSLAEAKKLKLQLSTLSRSVLCDRLKLKEVVVNLLANAIKFTPARTSIDVSIQEFQDQIEVRITDQGPGVPAEYRESIFQAFEQTPATKDSRQGVGLGLAICKLIVQAHGGSIGVVSDCAAANGHSKQSPGSTFWFRMHRETPAES